MQELTINLHMHTTYSDGTGSHADLAHAAIQSGVDVLLVTDHNTWVQGMDGYFREGRKRVLLLTGEEIHDQARDPQKNHLLVFGVGKGTWHPWHTIRSSWLTPSGRQGDCLSLPIRSTLPCPFLVKVISLGWIGMSTDLLAWNSGMVSASLKSVVRSKLDGIFYAFFPQALARGPLPGTLSIWDGLLKTNRKVVAVGGSDAHALHFSLGPLHRVVFPYEYHFSAVNTHLLVPHPLLGEYISG